MDNTSIKADKPSVGTWIVIISTAVFIGNMLSFSVEKSFQYWEKSQLEAENALALDSMAQEKARRKQIEDQARQQLIDAVKKAK